METSARMIADWLVPVETAACGGTALSFPCILRTVGRKRIGVVYQLNTSWPRGVERTASDESAPTRFPITKTTSNGSLSATG